VRDTSLPMAATFRAAAIKKDSRHGSWGVGGSAHGFSINLTLKCPHLLQNVCGLKV
jgi:hypothetical protein